MKIRKLPPVKYLQECFLYEKNTGKLFWRSRPDAHFSDIGTAKMWNKRWAGKEAFYGASGRHRFGHLDNQYCAAHRVVWKLVTGKEPPDIIDHKDQNKQNNRWKNLRAATKPQNCINRAASQFNTSGFSGVHKHRNKNKWVAQIGALPGKRYVGIFDSPEKAHRARQAALKSAYGEFAP